MDLPEEFAVPLTPRERRDFLLKQTICDVDFAAPAVAFLLNLIRPTDDINALLTAIHHKDGLRTPCVRVPRKTKTGVVNVGRKNLDLTVLTLRVFRTPQAKKKHIFYVNYCQIKETKDFICGNPYHIELQSISSTSTSKKVGGTYCVVTGCNNQTIDRKQHGLSFFRIPEKEKSPELYRYYFAAAARADIDHFADHHRICSAHFLDEDYETKNDKRLLKNGSVPTLNLPRKLQIPPPLRELVRTPPAELHARKLQEFWTAVTSADFDLSSLGSVHQWNVLENSPAGLLIAKARFIHNKERNVYLANSDVIHILPDLTFSLSSNGAIISRYNITPDLPTVVDSRTALAEVMAFDFAIADAVVKESPMPIKKDVQYYSDQLVRTLDEFINVIDQEAEPDGSWLPTGSTSKSDEHNHRIRVILSFSRQLVRNVMLKDVRLRRYSFSFTRFCSMLGSYSTNGYKFFRNFLCDVLPHPNLLRQVSSPDDIEKDIDMHHIEKRKEGKRKATLMSDNSRKLKKLKQLPVQESLE